MSSDYEVSTKGLRLRSGDAGFQILVWSHLGWNITKAELLREGILFCTQFPPWEFLLIKKLDFEKTKAT